MRTTFAALLLVAGCGSATSPAAGVSDAGHAIDASSVDGSVDAATADAASDARWQAPPTCTTGYVVDPSAKIGCRSPSEPGCAQCCTPSGATCTVRSWAPGSVTNVTPWYNDSRTLAACPSTCAPCADCLVRSEQDLCKILPAVQSCDCSVPSGPDPCEEPSSCACACSNYENDSRQCPQQAH